MIYLVHGDDAAGVERQVLGLRKKLAPGRVVNYDGQKFNREVWQAWQRQANLFSVISPLVVVKNASAIRLSTWQQFFQDYTSPQEFHFIFASHHQIRNRKVLALFPQQNIIFCRPAVSIFNLLDDIGQPLPKSLRFLDQLFFKMPAQLILYWLKRYFRELYWLVYGQTEKSGWQLAKQRQHLQKLGQSRVISWYRSLLWLDYQQKIGKLPEGLEIALVNLFLKDYYEGDGQR